MGRGSNVAGLQSLGQLPHKPQKGSGMAKAVFGPFEVSEDEIGRLQPLDLVQLLKRLIHADLQAAGVPVSAIHGSLKINVADGGEDVRVEWEGPPDRAGYVAGRAASTPSPPIP